MVQVSNKALATESASDLYLGRKFPSHKHFISGPRASSVFSQYRDVVNSCQEVREPVAEVVV
jgi:hypothetical protein